RRARVARGRLLVDRDRRREAFDRVDVGLLHQAEELARVGGERLDVPPLPLGVDRVEREARLARAREPGDHDQGVARQLDGDVLEVVLTGTGYEDSLRGGHQTQSTQANRRSLPLDSSTHRGFPAGDSPPERTYAPYAGQSAFGSRDRGA